MYQIVVTSRSRQRARPVFLSSLIVISHFASAWVYAATDTPWQSTASIRAVVSAYLQTQVGDFPGILEFNVGKLDPRLRLTQCDKALVLETPEHQNLLSKTTLAVKCPGGKPWSVYVPVQINAWQEVLAAAKSLPQGHTIEVTDIVRTKVLLTFSKQAYYMHDADLAGNVLQRSLAAGKPFEARFLKPTLLVKRGQEVILLASAGTLSVRMSGKALTDGAKGDLIKVRNDASQRIVEGRVLGSGTVLVNM